MSVVKIKNKKELEQLQAKLTMRLGRRLTQQETLDYCVMLGNKNIDKLVELVVQIPTLTPEKVEKFLEKRDELIKIPYNSSAKFENQDDDDIYNS